MLVWVLQETAAEIGSDVEETSGETPVKSQEERDEVQGGLWPSVPCALWDRRGREV